MQKSIKSSFLLLTLSNLAYFFFSSMSGFRPATLLVKVSLGLLLAASIVVDVYIVSSSKILNLTKYFNIEFIKSYKKLYLTNLLLIVVSVLFVLYSILSLIWTTAFQYGLFKSVNLFLNILFVLLANVYYLKRLHDAKNNFLENITVTIAVVTLSLAFFIKPFNYDSSQIINIQRWGHIQYSGFLSLTLIIFLNSYTRKSLNRSLKFSEHSYSLLLILFLIYGIYFTAMRSSFIGITLLLFSLFSFSLFDKKYKQFRINFAIIAVIPFLILFLKPFESGKAFVRFDNLLQYEEMKFNNDAPIKTRLDGYEESIKIIKQNLPFGTGFGGYKTQTQLSNYLNYPHNIFIETIVELGFPGIFLLLILFTLLIISALKSSPILFSLFIYALTISFFAKDIPDQSFLFLTISILLSKSIKSTS